MNPGAILKRLLLTALVSSGVVACGSAPVPAASGEPYARFNPSVDPYWLDPKWDKALLDAAQSAIHDPVDASDTSTPGLHATVKFTFLSGTAEYPEIVQGTGDADKDKLLLHQLAAAELPRATGVDADKPHEFVLDLDMPTPYETFQSTLYAAIDKAKVYPKEAIIEGAASNNTVGFDYRDGKASGITLVRSSTAKSLDKASLDAVTRASFLSTPSPYTGKPLHMEVFFCYTMASAETGRVFTIKNPCPAGRNVITVQATRMKVTTTESMRMN